MSSRGEVSTELAILLDAIADRVDQGLALKKDVRALRRMARQAAGEDRAVKIKVHAGRGHPADGAAGVQLQMMMARAVMDHRATHGGTLAEAYRALNGKFGKHAAGEEKLRKAWQEMRHLLELDEADRNAQLLARMYKAEGLSVVVVPPRGN